MFRLKDQSKESIRNGEAYSVYKIPFNLCEKNYSSPTLKAIIKFYKGDIPMGNTVFEMCNNINQYVQKNPRNALVAPIVFASQKELNEQKIMLYQSRLHSNKFLEQVKQLKNEFLQDSTTKSKELSEIKNNFIQVQQKLQDNTKIQAEQRTEMRQLKNVILELQSQPIRQISDKQLNQESKLHVMEQNLFKLATNIEMQYQILILQNKKNTKKFKQVEETKQKLENYLDSKRFNESNMDIKIEGDEKIFEALSTQDFEIDKDKIFYGQVDAAQDWELFFRKAEFMAQQNQEKFKQRIQDNWLKKMELLLPSGVKPSVDINLKYKSLRGIQTDLLHHISEEEKKYQRLSFHPKLNCIMQKMQDKVFEVRKEIDNLSKEYNQYNQALKNSFSKAFKTSREILYKLVYIVSFVLNVAGYVSQRALDVANNIDLEYKNKIPMALLSFSEYYRNEILNVASMLHDDLNNITESKNHSLSFEIFAFIRDIAPVVVALTQLNLSFIAEPLANLAYPFIYSSMSGSLFSLDYMHSDNILDKISNIDYSKMYSIPMGLS